MSNGKTNAVHRSIQRKFSINREAGRKLFRKILLYGPFFGYVCFVLGSISARYRVRIQFPEKLDISFQNIMIEIMVYLFYLPFSYIFGIMPAATFAWLYMRLTRGLHIYQFIARLIIAPLVGLATMLLFVAPFLLITRGATGFYFHVMIILSWGVAAAFMTVLLFDRRYAG